jgi:hypothetical protein
MRSLNLPLHANTLAPGNVLWRFSLVKPWLVTPMIQHLAAGQGAPFDLRTEERHIAW